MGSEFTFYEKDPIEHNGPLNLGYDEAKWVAEKLVWQTSSSTSSTSR